jgi:SAM-dependent methyltransferase
MYFKPPAPSQYSTLDNPIEVPCQVECYLFCREKYLKPTDSVLDVGFGLGYGLQIMAAKAEKLMGVEVDAPAVARAQRIFAGHPRIADILSYDGIHLPFPDKSVDVVTCIEIIEHVENYRGLLLEMARVAQRAVFIATPNRRPENTLKNGSPKNYWHLREWTKDELDSIFKELGLNCEWNFPEGTFEGPFTWANMPTQQTWSLVPIILLSEQ